MPASSARTITARLLVTLSVVAGAAGVQPSQALATPGYVIVDLGTLGNDYSIAYGLNGSRDAVGNSSVGPCCGYHAFRWRAGQVTDLGSLGADDSIARDVNTTGVIVGGSATGDGGSHAFAWSNGTITDLGVLTSNYSNAFAINDAGVVVGDGASLTGFYHALRWSGGTIDDLGTLGGDNSHARDINATGQIAGDADAADGSPHAVVWDSDGTPHDIGTLDGTYSNATGINDVGHVAGRAYIGGGANQRAFYWDGTTMIDIGTIGAAGTFSEGEAINNSDQIVGRSDSATGQHGFLWSGGTMIALDDLLPSGSGWQTADAFDINDDGVIAGYGYHTFDGQIEHGHLRAFLMFPADQATVPGASTNLLAAAGDGTASVSWAAPSYDGGSAITSYTVSASPGTSTVDVLAPATTATFTGLTNGTTYTFTVVAFNAVGPGPASAPSNAVTPSSGASPPQTAADTIPPEGGTVSSGSSEPTPTDSVVTSVGVPQTGAGGNVTIAESGIDESAPAGYQFLGQQVAITSTAATTSNNPLRISFVIDVTGLTPQPAPEDVTVFRTEASGSPTPLELCAAAGIADPDPCVESADYATNGTDIQLVVLTSQASIWNIGTTIGIPIAVTDAGYNPANAVVPFGQSAIWTFGGTRPHTVTDGTKLGPASAPLFDSGLRSSGTYAFAFWAAGSYSYRSTARSDAKGLLGTISVPLAISPTDGTTATTFTVQWASEAMPGYLSDTQYRFRAPGAKNFGKWVNWKMGAGGLSAPFIGSKAGTYEFHARVRSTSTGHVSGWSPGFQIVIHS